MYVMHKHTRLRRTGLRPRARRTFMVISINIIIDSMIIMVINSEIYMVIIININSMIIEHDVCYGH